MVCYVGDPMHGVYVLPSDHAKARRDGRLVYLLNDGPLGGFCRRTGTGIAEHGTGYPSDIVGAVVVRGFYRWVRH